MNWDVIREAVVSAIKTGAPIVAAAFPEASAAINIAQHIIDAANAAEPSAMALVNSIKSGEVPTNEQLKEYAERYEISYEALDHDIKEKIAELDAAEADNTDDK